VEEDSSQYEWMDKFTPQGLDKESSEFITRLDYLSGCISFRHNQIDILLSDLKNFLTANKEEVDDEEEAQGEPEGAPIEIDG